MGKLDGQWKRVAGERFFIVVQDKIIFRSVLVRDGRYSHSNDTLARSDRFKFGSVSLQEQVEETLDDYLSKERSVERQIDEACERVDNVYSDNW